MITQAMNRTLLALILATTPTLLAAAPRQREKLGRGVVAVRKEEGSAFISWRVTSDDPKEVAFVVDRIEEGKPPRRITKEPVTAASCFVDDGPLPKGPIAYTVQAVVDGKPGPASEPVMLAEKPYLAIPLKTLPGHTPNDASVGDLDGDGEYEIVLKQEMRPRDNSQAGTTGESKLEAYTLGGKFLWRINLGKNVREGAHYTPFLVFDFDGDGRAEVACRTADGTVDGTGKVLGDPNADHRNENGFVLQGPEFVTVFEGATGKALATVDYLPARGDVNAWGDRTGNRADRFLAAVAYLDGQRPSLIFCRGYYTRTVLVAWNWRDGKLSRVWTFDSDDGHRTYRGQGNHNLAVGDVDHDGRDEIIYGACAIDDDGRGLYSTGLGHGDAIHLGDLDPDRPGLEVFDIHERPRHPNGAEFRDAATGKLLWGKPSPDVGRGVALDIDPRHRGYESWASGRGLEGVWNVKGEVVSTRKPRSCNFGVWWDGDRLREILNGSTVTKWDWRTESETTLLLARGCLSNNGTKSTPALCADILGDWREEILWRSVDNSELRLYTTTLPTTHRFVTLMHDPQYRLSVAWQNVGYNLPTQPGFYLGEPGETVEK
jgi:rhamnogalacturonan endolyase